MSDTFRLICGRCSYPFEVEGKLLPDGGPPADLLRRTCPMCGYQDAKEVSLVWHNSDTPDAFVSRPMP